MEVLIDDVEMRVTGLHQHLGVAPRVVSSPICDGRFRIPRAEMSEFIRDNPNRRLSHAGVAIGDFALDP